VLALKVTRFLDFARNDKYVTGLGITDPKGVKKCLIVPKVVSFLLGWSAKYLPAATLTTLPVSPDYGLLTASYGLLLYSPEGTLKV
jgi:hypothetical protein